MPNAFVTIARFRDVTDAKFYESLLRENGIQAFIPEEYTAATRYPSFWFLFVTSQIRLQVPFGEQERALDVLREAAERAEDTVRLVEEAGQEPPEDQALIPSGQAETELHDYPEDAGDMGGLALLAKWIAIAAMVLAAYWLVPLLFAK